MTKERNDGLLYLRDYPQLRKWINQCVACQRLGYKPEMPEAITPGAAARNIRRYFPEMEINELGLCQQCAAATSAENSMTGPTQENEDDRRA